jgi:cob(I)alamin adenosyltransferase
MNKGYVHVYTGNGEGKTTAALGLAMRAAGAGLQVFIAQFMKGTGYSELRSFARLSDRVTVKQYGGRCCMHKGPGPDDVAFARRGLEEVRQALASGTYQVVIMDEAAIAAHYRLIGIEELLEIIKGKPDHMELVITGRWVDDRIVECAGLVTEMREVKHYYAQGVLARVGIER